MARTYQDRSWRWLYRPHFKMNSIQSRLMALAAVVFILVWVGAAIISNVQGFRNTQAILEREVATTASILLSVQEHALDDFITEGDDFDHSIQIWQWGELVFSSGREMIFEHGVELDYSKRIDGLTWVFAKRCQDDRCVLYSAAHTPRHQNLYCLVVSIFGPLFIILGIGFCLMMLAIHHALGPLNNLASSVGKLNPENPQNLETLKHKAELIPLICSINAFSERIRALVDRERMLLGSCAHEIRTPLAGVIGQLQLVEDNKNISKARECAYRTARIAEQFLAFAASKSLNSSAQTVENFDLCETIRNVLVSPIEQTDIRVEMTGACELMVCAHPFAISAIASNLVQNAIKYGKPTEGMQHIRLHVEADAGEALLTIEDNGIGLPHSAKSKVFREFFRLNRTSQSHGSGLGLSIVQEICRQYAGTVELSKSNCLGGVQVNVRLPILSETRINQHQLQQMCG